GRKKAYQPDRQHLFDQLWVNGILLIEVGILKIIVTNYPWQYNDQGNQDLEKSRYQQSLLGLLQVFCPQGPLDDRLVHSPEIELINDKARKQNFEGQYGIPCPYHIEFLGGIFVYLDQS